MTGEGRPLSGRVLRLGARIRNLHYQAALLAAFVAAPHFAAVIHGNADGSDWVLSVFWVLFAVGSLVAAKALRARIDRGDWVAVLHDR